MTPQNSTKPHLIVIAIAINPHTGGEPGKGWWWISAMLPYFTLHIVTSENSIAGTRAMLAPEDEVHFYVPNQRVDFTRPMEGYLQYRRYLDEALDVCRKIQRDFPVVGLWHLILGSFRVLPRYDQLRLPYVVGPVGGGECTPLSMLWSRSVPFLHKIEESLRPLVNRASALYPPVRACMKGASLVLSTSEETREVTEFLGARHSMAVFPDSYDYPIDAETVVAEKAARKDGLKEKIHLMWQGRLHWWKGPDLALKIVRQAIANGIPVELTMVGARAGSWETGVGKSVKRLAEETGLIPHVRFVETMSREDFLAMVKQQDGFLATSLHDSGGIPLIEAQSRGLPCLTPGLGGHREAACPDAGVSGPVKDVDDYVEQSVRCIAAWHANPDTWVDECSKAVAFSQQFTKKRLQQYVRDLALPVFSR